MLEEVIRFPHQWRHQQTKKQKGIIEDRLTLGGALFDFWAFCGLEIIPVIYVFTRWLSFANYGILSWLNWCGVVILVLALGLLWQAHHDLDRQWSPSLAIQTEHVLITRGIYRYLRHPIYTALWLMGLAQACLMPNWIAGYSGLFCFLPLYWIRVPQEEQALLRHFGEAYRTYMQHTSRLLPRLGR